MLNLPFPVEVELNVPIHELLHEHRFRVSFIYVIAVFVVHDESAYMHIRPTAEFD
jgi:hypothetical protein